MNNNIKICPSMLSADFTKMGQELIDVVKAGADCIHWDIMDGSFVDQITFGAHTVRSHRNLTSIRFDVHLMIENPHRHIAAFADAGADLIIVHAEACNHLHKTLSLIKSFGKMAGLAFNPASSIDPIEYCADVLDAVLVMSVNPGRSGQIFIESQITKIAKLSNILSPNVEICVDGGINQQTLEKCVKNGAKSFVMGSYLFCDKNYGDVIKSVKSLHKPTGH
jgi:ribulose-phosphate 3-epimerase